MLAFSGTIKDCCREMGFEVDLKEHLGFRKTENYLVLSTYHVFVALYTSPHLFPEIALPIYY